MNAHRLHTNSNLAATRATRAAPKVDGWPDRFHVVPAWVYAGLTAAVFALGSLGGIVVALIDMRHRHRTSG